MADRSGIEWTEALSCIPASGADIRKLRPLPPMVLEAAQRRAEGRRRVAEQNTRAASWWRSQRPESWARLSREGDTAADAPNHGGDR